MKARLLSASDRLKTLQTPLDFDINKARHMALPHSVKQIIVSSLK